jgi:hypothetical protein
MAPSLVVLLEALFKEMMFYTYAHYKPDNSVFYIGKGRGHRAHAKDNRNQHWKNVVAKHGFKVEILSGWDKETDALLHEQFLIACFRGMGYQLANITDGGEGISGHKHSDTSKAKMCNFQKVFQNTERMKAVRVSNGEKSKTPERRQKQSEFVRQYMADPKNREHSRLGALKQSSNPLFIEAQRQRALKRMTDPKYRNLLAKPCICVETGQVFQSQAEAAKWVGPKARSQTINRAISKQRKTAYGFQWEMVNKE